MPAVFTRHGSAGPASHSLRSVTLAAVALAALSCEDPVDTGPSSYILEVVSGGNQAAVAGSPLPDSLVVRVVDGAGRPVPEVRVNWTPAEGAGEVPRGFTVTRAEGLTWSKWTLGVAGGPQKVTASIATSSVTFEARAAPVARGVDPWIALVGEDPFTIAVTGIGFTPGSRVEVDGTEISTTFVSEEELSASVPATLLATERRAEVMVVDPEIPLRTSGVDLTVMEPLSIPDAPQSVISAGSGFTCALATDGATHCWGAGRAEPVPLESGRFSGVWVADGGLYQNVCAVDFAGDGWCWSKWGAATPIKIAGGHQWVELTPGCGLTADGEIYCWWDVCRYGCGTSTEEPQKVAWPDRFVSVSNAYIGAYTACGLTERGQAVCWNPGKSGGPGVPVEPRGPELAGHGLVLREFAVGANGDACGVTLDGVTYCWSYDPLFSMYDPQPRAIVKNKLERISMGGAHVCGLSTEGDAYCWGGNSHGQVGDGTTGGVVSGPRKVDSRRFVTIDAGVSQTCAVAEDGAAYCWGDRTNGQLGDGVSHRELEPGPVKGGHAFTSLNGACAIDNAGQIWCWGPRLSGPVGAHDHEPVRIDGPEGKKFVQLERSRAGLCALAEDGDVHCGSTLGRVALPEKATTVVSGFGHRCALGESGAAYCWGSNSMGQLGNGSIEPSSSPVQVAGEVVFSALDAGSAHTCGLSDTGRMYCWGEQDYPVLGTEDVGSCPTYKSWLWIPCATAPVPVDQETAYQRLFVEAFTTCGEMADGTLECWGIVPGGSEQCGFWWGNSNSCSRAPMTILDGLAISTFDPYDDDGYACAVTTDAALYCHAPQDGAFVPVLGGHQISDVDMFDGMAGGTGMTTCALTMNGTALCWGDNRLGQLGNGVDTVSPTPSRVLNLLVRTP